MSDDYDLNIDNYTEDELLKLFNITEPIYLLSTIRLSEHLDEFKQNIDMQNSSLFIEFISNVEDRLTKKISELNSNPNNLIPKPEQNVINSNETIFPTGVINPIEKKTITKVLNIDSIFRVNYSRTSASDFIWNFQQPETNVVSARVSSVDLPITWYNVRENKNTFIISFFNIIQTNNSTHEITIPPGNYSSENFIKTLNFIFDAGENELNNLIAENDGATNKIIIRMKIVKELYGPDDRLHYDDTTRIIINFYNNKKNLSENEAFKEFQKTIGWYMGFRKQEVEIQQNNNVQYISKSNNNNYTLYYFAISACTSYGNNVDNYLFLDIDDYNNNCVCQPIVSSSWNSTNIANNLMARITLNSSYKNVLYDDGADKVFKERVYMGPVTLNKFKIQLIDKYGEIVDLNKNDFSFTLELTKLY